MTALFPLMYWVSPRIGLVLVTILHVVFSYTHWVFTDQGRIRSKVSKVIQCPFVYGLHDGVFCKYILLFD